jgi:hypothetical protein
MNSSKQHDEQRSYVAPSGLVTTHHDPDAW